MTKYTDNNNKEGKYTGDWWQKRNKARRERYNNDPEYRKNMLIKSRLRRVARGQSAKVVFAGKDNLTQACDFGRNRIIEVDGTLKKELTFCVAELGYLLGFGIGMATMYRWCKNSQIPRPVFRSVHERGAQPCVFTLDEVIGIVDELDNHFGLYAYFRKDHKETINKIKQRVDEARERRGFKEDG